ncbi:MATE family efflux transporter [Undibacterium rugosum]|uniref:Multidrug-efflux transporter n=1 Tax=Undibacterium rugosum TaxID=2762291 RepID=A0A923KU77_9BURK|nr:MATE family efflux transporter [Undibacterium rugosum]MBC3936814.1 MATE family efflux transporter [Undibacterium rugosum]MBR7776896.1 MATE family efflux transporter [Undibacterium rugosum]
MSETAGGTRHHMRRIGALAWPVLVGQLATVSNGVIDTALTSRYSATDLAALSIGVSIYISIFVGLNGVLQALSPTIAQLYGAQDFRAIGQRVKQGVWLATVLTVIGCLALLYPRTLLSISHADASLTDKAAQYLQILAYALPATMGFRIYSALNNAIGKPKMVMAIQVLSLGLKFPLNSLFIFGGFGLPAMGGPGCAVATVIISWLTLLIAWSMLRHARLYKQFLLFGTGFVWPHWPSMKQLLRLGIPMGLSYLIEVTAYAFMALFIARFGEIAVSGHQLSANFGTVLYMLPLSIANACATLTAQALGAGQHQQAKFTANAAIRLALCLSLPLALLIVLGRSWILLAYTDNPAIIEAAMPLFILVAIYQIFDALQVIIAFVLRAYHVAIVPTLLYALTLWGCGLGGGYLLGIDPGGWFPANLHGATGFWIANVISIALIAISLWYYLRHVQHQHHKTDRSPV